MVIKPIVITTNCNNIEVTKKCNPPPQPQDWSVFNIFYYLKISLICSKLLKQKKKKKKMLKKQNTKNLKIKFQQRGVRLKYQQMKSKQMKQNSIGKRIKLLQFYTTFANKIGMYLYLSAITSQDKIVFIKLNFNNASRLNQSSPMNNTVTKE